MQKQYHENMENKVLAIDYPKDLSYQLREVPNS